MPKRSATALRGNGPCVRACLRDEVAHRIGQRIEEGGRDADGQRRAERIAQAAGVFDRGDPGHAADGDGDRAPRHDEGVEVADAGRVARRTGARAAVPECGPSAVPSVSRRRPLTIPCRSRSPSSSRGRVDASTGSRPVELGTDRGSTLRPARDARSAPTRLRLRACRRVVAGRSTHGLSDRSALSDRSSQRPIHAQRPIRSRPSRPRLGVRPPAHGVRRRRLEARGDLCRVEGSQHPEQIRDPLDAARAAFGVEPLRLALELEDDVGVEQLAHLDLAEKLGEERGVDRQRRGATLGERASRPRT